MNGTASAFLRLYAELIRRPGETAEEARQRARRELPTVARLAAAEAVSGRLTALQRARAI